MYSTRIILPESFDVTALIAQVYNLSAPIGLGHIHFIPGLIPIETLTKLVEGYRSQKEKFSKRSTEDYMGTGCLLGMDYVHGRCCKFGIYYDFKTKESYIHTNWPDHSMDTFMTLLSRTGLSIPEVVTS